MDTTDEAATTGGSPKLLILLHGNVDTTAVPVVLHLRVGVFDSTGMSVLFMAPLAVVLEPIFPGLVLVEARDSKFAFAGAALLPRHLR